MKPSLKILLGLVFVSFSLSCAIVRQGEVGVRRSWGRIDEVALREGAVAYNPLTTVIIRVPTRTVNQEVSLPLPSKEGLTIASEISILYRVIPEAAPRLLREVGIGYETQLIMPVFRSAAADISSQFVAKDMHSGARSTIETEIATRMNQILEPKGVLVENVLMKSITLPRGLARAIEEKLEAEQQAQRMEFVKDTERREAERRLIAAEGQRNAGIVAAEAQRRVTEIEAEGKAKALLLDAKARAEATLLESEAQAEANRKLQGSLSSQVLQLMAIEAFRDLTSSDGSRVIITDGNTPFLGLPPEMMKTLRR